ncbi:probable pectinesterase/pectinesterase inhibitor 12 [Asparagus officinalis]|uniref:probable pectinesterase/pectinesterase inhibitor 12 n=1 Tax=Asparagus officinalis TaxID=4686 RepID=UPI00098E7761|nr:probable pectinesterase/pectinesterase inhibitor 12 [Asparagus officinalis]
MVMMSSVQGFILVMTLIFIVNATSTTVIVQLADGGVHDDQSTLTLVVAPDGSCTFIRVGDAIAFALNNSDGRTIIQIRAGIYDDYIEVPNYKTNITLYGEESSVTIIRGNRNVNDAISGQGFIAQDICFKNTSGASKGQAVALRVDVGFVAFYRCAIDEYQYTLFARRGQQSYRECNILCTVDFIFGDAYAFFQNCMICAKLPMQGQDNAITAQGRESESEATCFSMQNCSIL